METIHTMIIDPLRDMLYYVAGFIPTLISALLVLTIGIYVSKLVKDLVSRLFVEIRLDKIADKLGLSEALKKGGVKHSVSGLLSSLVYFVFIVSFFFMTMAMVGLTSMTGLVDRLLAYVPQVLSAVVVLVLGMVVAKVIGHIVHTAAHLTGMPSPHIYQRVTHYAIVIFAFTIALEELGYGSLLVGKTFHILFGGIVFAMALAFGLGGKDYAAKYFGTTPKK